MNSEQVQDQKKDAYSFRITKDTKHELQEIIEDLQGKGMLGDKGDVINYFIKIHRDVAAIERVGDFADDYNSANLLLGKVLNIIMNMSEKATGTIEVLREKEKDVTAKLSKQLQNLQNELNECEWKYEESVVIRKQFEEREEDRRFRITKLEEENGAFRKRLEENEARFKEVSKLAEENLKLKYEIEKYGIEMENLQKQCEKLRYELDQAKRNFEKEKKDFKKEANLEKKEALLKEREVWSKEKEELLRRIVVSVDSKK